MLKTSTVTNVSAAGTWDSDQYGTFYKFEIQFENGDLGQALCKIEAQETYIIGDKITYEFTDGKFPKVKRVRENPIQKQPINNNQDIIVRQVAFKGAVEFVCSNGGGLDDILNYTDIFNTFILTGDKPETSDKLPF